MPGAVFDDVSPFDPERDLAAVVLCRTPHGNLHVGLLHRARAQHAEALHLGWQDQMQQQWPWRRLWAVPPAEPEKLRSVAGLARLVWRRFDRDRVFPYALGDVDGRFDGGGRLQLSPTSRGLTCASFVLALFRSAGIPLLNAASWPIRPEEDREFLRAISGFASPEHLALLTAQVDAGVVRIYPQEVLGACTLPELPADFEQTRPAALGVLLKLDEAGV